MECSFLEARTGAAPVASAQGGRERPLPRMLVWPPWIMLVFAGVCLLLLQLTCTALREHKARRVQEAVVAVAVQAADRRLRRATLETRMARMTEVSGRSDASGQELLYDTLRDYLMLGQGEHVDAGTAQLDMALVARARRALAGMPLSARAYSLAKRMVAQEAAEAGAKPAAPGADGLYSVAGYRRFAQLSWRATADLARDDPVLARREADRGPRTVVPARADAMQLYFADYIRTWDAWLGEVRRAPPAHRRVLLARAARETKLAAARVDALAPGVGTLVQDRPGPMRRPSMPAAPHPVDRHFAALHRFVANPGCRPPEWREKAPRNASSGCD